MFGPGVRAVTIAKVVKDKILGKSKGFNCPIKLATFALKKG